jgi:hypothetical protein
MTFAEHCEWAAATVAGWPAWKQGVLGGGVVADPNFIVRVLSVAAKADLIGELHWSVKDGDVHFVIDCSDLFFWACADAEPLTPDNIALLEQTIEDCRAAHKDYGICYAGSLFCARARKMRPQGACYPEERELWPLFDACGAERETGLGNPCKPGEYKRTCAVSTNK